MWLHPPRLFVRGLARSRTPGSNWVFPGLDRLAGEVGKQQGMLGLENQIKGLYGLDGLPGILGVVV